MSFIICSLFIEHIKLIIVQKWVFVYRGRNMGKHLTRCIITVTWVSLEYILSIHSNWSPVLKRVNHFVLSKSLQAFCITYLISSSAYRNSIYVYKFKGIDEEIEKYMCIQCLLTIIMALICAVFVESEVVHIFGPIFVKK